MDRTSNIGRMLNLFKCILMQSINIHLEPTSMQNTNDNEEMSPSDSLVKAEEVGIILVVLAIWVWECMLFYIRWVAFFEVIV